MSKKFLSVMVLATAMLLPLPSQAQNIAKKKATAGTMEYRAQQRLTSEQCREMNAAQAKAADAARKNAGQAAMSQQSTPSSANSATHSEASADAQNGRKAPAKAGKQTGLRLPGNRAITPSANGNAPRRQALRAGTTDEHGIIREPEEGVHTTLKRVGSGYFMREQEVYYGPQSGTVELVETADGTVYVKDIISNYIPGTWVKGTKNGNTITIPTGQPLDFNTTFNATVSLYWGAMNSDPSNPWSKLSTESITFTIVDDMISLQGSSDKLFIGIFWDDDNTFSGFGDYNTVWASPMRAITAANIDLLPYNRALNTIEEWNEFGTIDANQDENTWFLSDKDIVTYNYSSANDGDDWLVSPAIMLEKDREYHFSIEACCQSGAYPEQFEVRASTVPMADALAAGTEVIPSTEVNITDFTPYETFTFKVSESGYYHIGIHCTSVRDRYMLKVRYFALESLSAPDAVTDLTVVQTPDQLEATITFTAPVKNMAGSDLTTNISKIEVLRNGEVVKTLTDVVPGSAQTVVDHQPTVGWFAYQVVPYDTNGTDMGNKSEIVEVLAKATIEVPFNSDLSDGRSMDLFTVIDNNTDGSTWVYDNDYAAVLYQFSKENTADDYLVTLPVHLQPGKIYTVKVNANARDSFFKERFEVKMGKEATADGLSTTLIPVTELTSNTPEDFEANFTVDDEGEYFIAVHALSKADMYYLILHSMSITDGPLYTAPAAPELSVVPAAEGGLSAAINAIAPTKNIQGDELNGPLKVDFYRDGAFVGSLTDVAPGATATFTDELPAPAMRMYQAVVANENGFGEKSGKVRRFVGIDIPTDIQGAPIVTETENGLHMEWTAVGGVGRNGGYVNPAEVVYGIWNNEFHPTISGGRVLAHEKLITEVTGTSSADIDLDTEEGDQMTKYLSVVASTTTGSSNDTYVNWVVGKSYELPFRESFQDRATHYFWATNAGLMSIEDAMDEDGFALRLVAREMPSNGLIYLESGKIKINDVANPTLTFNAKSTTVNRIYVYGNVDGGTPSQLGAFDLTGDYQTFKVPLASLKAGKYAQFTFLASIDQAASFDAEGYVTDLGDNIAMDDIRVVDLYDYNLAIDLKNAAKVTAGKSLPVKATVENKGEKTVSNYTVTIKAGEKTLLSQTYKEPLPMFALNKIETELSTTVFDQIGEVAITAEVSIDSEMKPEDNTAQSTVSVTEPAVSSPTNLTAQVTDLGVDLSWTAPVASGAEKFESFEDTEAFPEFSIGGITATNHFGQFGEWKLYDGNGLNLYGFPGYSQVPNLGYPSAWLVMNPSSPQLGQDISADYGAHSGTQYLVSSCPAEPKGNIPAADHWLISPEVSGKAQTISFYVRSFVSMYGDETFEVLASSTDDQVESFTLVSSNTSTTTDWQQVTVDLPEGTKYFAIRHTSPDIWGMMLDDITYQGVGADLASYNVYFKGNLVATVAGDATTYLVDMDKLENGENLPFDLTAVYEDGSESLPATVYVTIISQDIRQIAVDGQPVDIYSLDGRLVRSQATSLEGLRGVYVVNGQKFMVK